MWRVKRSGLRHDSGIRPTEFIMQRFQLSGIEHGQFEHLFLLADDELKELGALRRRATESPGFPCRVSLQDAEVGEELLLLPYLHQPTASPYRASGPIFIRRNATQRILDVGEVPAYVTRRQISVRVYDSSDMMVDATVCDGPAVASELDHHFSNTAAAYIHLHNAKQGCFSCLAARAR
jgi:hypothetical protein